MWHASRVMSLHMRSAGASGQDDGAGEGETIGRQLALLEARGGGARLDAACAAAERLLALLADAGPPGGFVCKEEEKGARSRNGVKQGVLPHHARLLY